MDRNYECPQWAKAENMEMSRPLCELWGYPDETEKSSQRKYAVRKKIAEMLYRLADGIYSENRKIKKRMEYV